MAHSLRDQSSWKLKTVPNPILATTMVTGGRSHVTTPLGSMRLNIPGEESNRAITSYVQVQTLWPRRLKRIVLHRNTSGLHISHQFRITDLILPRLGLGPVIKGYINPLKLQRTLNKQLSR